MISLASRKGRDDILFTRSLLSGFCGSDQLIQCLRVKTVHTLRAMYSRSKNKRNTPVYFSINYRTEVKLVSIIMDYCLLQFDALKFYLGIRVHGEGSQPNFNFFNINPEISQRNRKVHLSNCQKNFFYNISNISLRFIRLTNYN